MFKKYSSFKRFSSVHSNYNSSLAVPHVSCESYEPPSETFTAKYFNSTSFHLFSGQNMVSEQKNEMEEEQEGCFGGKER